MEYASFLRKHIEEIITLSDEEFALILQYFSYKSIKKKDYLIKTGKNVTSEFLVVEGLLKAFTHNEEGKEFIVQFAMENW